MEALLVNRCVFSKENLLEMTKAIRKSSSIALIVCSIILLVVSMLNFVVKGNVSTGIVMLVLAVFFGVFDLWLPGYTAKSMYKRYQMIYHKEISSELQFFDDSILSLGEQAKAESRMSYAKVTRVISTKCLYVIRLNAQLVLLVDKNGFEKGDCAGFETLIKQKATKAKFNF
ncbi:MAG: YcxB family protein [Clostridiaceae bacterium]